MFVLALGVPVVLLLVSLALPRSAKWLAGLATQVAELLGLGSIRYPLWIPPDAPATLTPRGKSP